MIWYEKNEKKVKIMASLWLNYVINDNEILINIDLSRIDTFDSNEIDQDKLEADFLNYMHKCIDNADISITITFIRNQNSHNMFESKCNCTDIDSDLIHEFIDSYELTGDIYKSDEQLLEEKIYESCSECHLKSSCDLNEYNCDRHSELSIEQMQFIIDNLLESFDMSDRNDYREFITKNHLDCLYSKTYESILNILKRDYLINNTMDWE